MDYTRYHKLLKKEHINNEAANAQNGNNLMYSIMD